jgi:RHS repeat-associated protein
VFKQAADGKETYYVWAGSQLLGSYQLFYESNGDLYSLAATSTTQWLAGNKIGIREDRLGSNVGVYGTSKYYPYGDGRDAEAGQTGYRFATYYREGASGLDYADQRWYASKIGRFLTPDPYQASGGPSNPQSWNRYSYVENDPVNFMDPSGLRRMVVESDDVEHRTILILGYYYNGEDLVAYPVYGESRQTGRVREQFYMTNTERAEEGLWRGMVRGMQALSLNEDCRKLFGNEDTRDARFNPMNVLQSLVLGYLNGTGSEYGQIKIDPKLQGARVSRPLGIVGTITVTIGLSTLQANPSQVAHTLLHELGHVFDITRGSGDSGVLTPDSLPSFMGGDRRSQYNDWLIDQNCFGGSLGYKRPEGYEP